MEYAPVQPLRNAIIALPKLKRYFWLLRTERFELGPRFLELSLVLIGLWLEHPIVRKREFRRTYAGV